MAACDGGTRRVLEGVDKLSRWSSDRVDWERLRNELKRLRGADEWDWEFCRAAAGSAQAVRGWPTRGGKWEELENNKVIRREKCSEKIKKIEIFNELTARIYLQSISFNHSTKEIKKK